MKSKLYILLWFMLLLTPVVHAAQSPPCAVYIIIDPSWSCEYKLDDFRSLTRQISVSLKSGDYMEILSAGTTNPKVCLAQYMGQNPRSEFHEIQSALEDINSSMFYDANISRAVSTSIARSKRLAYHDFNPKVIFVFTDGKLKPMDLQQMKALYSTLEHENIELYLTGKQSSDRELLIAGNQEKLHFFLIHEANPAQWLKKRRPIIMEEKSTISAVEIPAVEQTALSESETDFEIEQRTKMRLKVTRDSPAETTVIEGKADFEAATDTEEATAVVPELADEPNTPLIIEDKSSSTLWMIMKKFLLGPWFWLIMGASIITGTIVLLLLLDYKKANALETEAESRKKKNTNNFPDRLVVRIGDRTQHLGRVDQIRKIHIGSGSDNGIQIYDTSVPKRHLRLIRKGRDLYLKNLSTKPAWINEIPLSPGKTESLPLPSILKLSDSASIRIELQKKPVIQTQTKEVSDGTER